MPLCKLIETLAGAMHDSGAEGTSISAASLTGCIDCNLILEQSAVTSLQLINVATDGSIFSFSMWALDVSFYRINLCRMLQSIHQMSSGAKT